jgi:hypothetical protein
VVKNHFDRFLVRSVAGGNVEELLGSSWALAPQLVDQGLIGGPRQEGLNHIGVSNVGQLIALLGEASNVLVKSFIQLLPIVLEVLRVSGAHVGALENTHEDLFEVHPTSNLVGREML